MVQVLRFGRLVFALPRHYLTCNNSTFTHSKTKGYWSWGVVQDCYQCLWAPWGQMLSPQICQLFKTCSRGIWTITGMLWRTKWSLGSTIGNTILTQEWRTHLYHRGYRLHSDFRSIHKRRDYGSGVKSRIQWLHRDWSNCYIAINQRSRLWVSNSNITIWISFKKHWISSD